MLRDAAYDKHDAPMPNGQRVLVAGSSCIASAVAASLDVVMYRPVIVRAMNDNELMLMIRESAINGSGDDTVVIVLTEGRSQLPERLFRLHTALRRQFTYAGRDYAWIGGLVGAAIGTTDASILKNHPLFATLGGHRLITGPLRLVEIVAAIRDVGLLFPRAWGMAIRRTGLASFWQLLAESRAKLEVGEWQLCHNLLSRAVAELLDKDHLCQLLPHATTISRLRLLRQQLTAIDGKKVSAPVVLKEISEQLTDIMNEYRIGIGD